MWPDQSRAIQILSEAGWQGMNELEALSVLISRRFTIAHVIDLRAAIDAAERAMSETSPAMKQVEAV